jgi:Protein of unknown function (DUF2505)
MGVADLVPAALGPASTPRGPGARIVAPLGAGMRTASRAGADPAGRSLWPAGRPADIVAGSPNTAIMDGCARRSQALVPGATRTTPAAPGPVCRSRRNSRLESPMEQKYAATIDKVFALLSDPKWLQERGAAMGELSTKVKAKKSGGGVTLTMNRRVRRDLPALVSKVLSPESDLVFEETWSAPGADGARTGTLTMEAVGQPVKMSATFELAPSGKGCVYRITHKCKSSVPLIGGVVEKFAQGQVESGCADEFAYLVTYLKNHK